ncbi:MAG: GumC family protein [Hyphomicrobiaceae bacterium]
MRAHVQSNPDDIDITSLWSVLKRSGPRILLFSGLVGALTYGGLSLMPAKYKAEAQIRIGGQGVSDPFRDPKVGNGSTPENVTVKVDKEAIASQVVALRSRDLAAKLTADLKLNARPEFNSALGGQDFVGGMLRLAGLAGPRPGESEEERVYNAYFKALQVSQVKDTRVITVEFQSTDNELAARAANRLVELYQEWLRSQGLTVTQDASDWLRPQIEKLAKEVADAEAAVEDFRKKADIFRSDSTKGTGLNEQQLSDLTSEVTRARTARSEIETRARSARELMQRGVPDAIQDVQKSPVIQGLIAQRVRAEREKAEAETQLLSGHPRMKQLNANVTDLRRQITREAALIVEGLEKEAKVFALREELAVKSLDEMKSRVGSKSVDVARLAGLEGLAKAKRKELETLQASFEATRARVDAKSQPLEAQLISSARPSSVPHSPKKPQLAALASAASLILGFVFVVTRELLGGARRQGQPQPVPASAPVSAPVSQLAAAGATAVPANRAAPANAMAAAAKVAPTATGAATAVAQAARAGDSDARPAPTAGFATLASADTLARRLAGNGEGQGGYRTVIVGDADGMDVREDAADLAGALTAAGKQVVLVDWSFDGKGMAEALGLEASPGLMDLVEGRASFEDVIRRLPDGDAHVVPCGTAMSSGPGNLDGDRINLVLDALDEAYDHIVVTGEHAAVAELFLTIQGRFDAGVLVCDSRRRGRSTEAAPGTFLGYQVTDIDVVRLDRTGQETGRKMQLARSVARPEQRV